MPAKEVIIIPNPLECCFYRLQEGTRNEYVSIGSDGNVLRWANTGGPEQLWLIVPVNAAKCKIQTKQNGEFMSVGSNGNILRWANSDGPEQEFSFANPSGEWWNIEESTRNEFVAVGGNGNILRWAGTGGREQKFKLVPVDAMAKPQTQLGECEPGAIGDVPRISAFGDIPPERTKARLIAETLIPAVYVEQDPAYSGRVQQVAQNPYYLLRREQYWDRSGDRGAYYEHDGYREYTRSVSVKFGFSRTNAKEVEDSLGVKISASGEFTFAGATIAISSIISRELKVKTSQVTEVTSERTETFEVRFPRERFVYAQWSMVDHYQLLNVQRNLVREWEVVLMGTTISDGYPRPLAATVVGS